MQQDGEVNEGFAVPGDAPASPTMKYSTYSDSVTPGQSSSRSQTSKTRLLDNIPLLRPDSLILEASDEEDELDFVSNLQPDATNSPIYRTLSPVRSLNDSPMMSGSSFSYSDQNSPSHPNVQFARQNVNISSSLNSSARLLSAGLYSIPNGSNSSVSLSVPNTANQTRHVRTSSSTQQYIPGPMLPPRNKSPMRPKSPVRHSRNSSPIRGASPTRKPFNFQSMMMHGNGSSHSLSNDSDNQVNNNRLSVGGGKTQYRRGHRYKHSSISMNMFQENVKKPALNIPKSYAIPSFDEVISSLTSHQKMNITWTICHLILACSVYLIGFKYSNTSLSTLSHLVFYDALANLLLVVVTIMMNFDFWGSSSLKYPFGLGRIEVLVGFALSVSLLFVGLDLISHVFEELVIELVLGHNTGESESEHSHHIHENKGSQMNPVMYEILVFTVMAVTILSSRVILGDTAVQNPNSKEDESSLKKSAKTLMRGRSRRRSKAILDETLDLNNTATQLSNTLTNLKKHNTMNTSTSNLTLIFAVYCMFYPALHATEYVELINQVSTVLLACSVLYVSFKLLMMLSNILLLGKPYGLQKKNIDDVIRNRIETLDSYRSNYKIEDLMLSKVNYKIFIAIIKIKMYGATDDDESKLRYYTERIIRDELSKSSTGYQNGDTDDSLAMADKKKPELSRKKSVVDFLNSQEFDFIDNTGETFEITIDIDRL